MIIYDSLKRKLLQGLIKLSDYSPTKQDTSMLIKTNLKITMMNSGFLRLDLETVDGKHEISYRDVHLGNNDSVELRDITIIDTITMD